MEKGAGRQTDRGQTGESHESEESAGHPRLDARSPHCHARALTLLCVTLIVAVEGAMEDDTTPPSSKVSCARQCCMRFAIA